MEKIYSKEMLNEPGESPLRYTQQVQKEGLELCEVGYRVMDVLCREIWMEWCASAWDIDSQKFLHKYDLKYSRDVFIQKKRIGGNHMSAKIEYLVGKNKINLGVAAPLDCPLIIHIEPSSVCNLKCGFCPNHKLQISQLGIMSMSVFNKIMEDALQFPQKPKQIMIGGRGEPLVNKNISEIIKKSKTIAEKVRLSTNGVLLNPELNQEIADSGIDEIRVSIEALDDNGYAEIAGRRISVAKLRDAIADLYKRKKETLLYVKIADIGLQGNRKEYFYDMYSDISDMVAVETISDIFPGYTYIGKDNLARFGGEELEKTKICPVLFKSLFVRYDGGVGVCATDWKNKIYFSNIMNQSLPETWNSLERYNMQIAMLSDGVDAVAVCKTCTEYLVNADDTLDSFAFDIKERLHDKYPKYCMKGE